MLKKIMGPKICLLVIYIIRFNRHTLVLIGDEYCFQAFNGFYKLFVNTNWLFYIEILIFKHYST